MARKKIELTSADNRGYIDLRTGRQTGVGSVPLICERIRFYREKKGIEQKALAKAVGVTANSVSNWENGRSRPDVNLLPGICSCLGISLYELFGIEENPGIESSRRRKLLSGYEILSPGHRRAVDQLIESLAAAQRMTEAPQLLQLTYFSRTLAAGTGDPTEIDEEAEKVYVYKTPETSRADYIFRVNGDSMEPRFRSGQDVLVQRVTSISGLEYGEIGAFITGNETYIKKYGKDGLYSLNEAYPVMRFDDEAAVYLIGRVLGVMDPQCYASQADIENYI